MFKISRSPIPMKPLVFAAWTMLMRTDKSMFRRKGSPYLRDSFDNYSPMGALCKLHSLVHLCDEKWEKYSDCYMYLDREIKLPDEVITWAFGIESKEDIIKIRDFCYDFDNIYRQIRVWPTTKEANRAFGLSTYESDKRNSYRKNRSSKENPAKDSPK